VVQVLTGRRRVPEMSRGSLVVFELSSAARCTGPFLEVGGGRPSLSSTVVVA